MLIAIESWRHRELHLLAIVVIAIVLIGTSLVINYVLVDRETVIVNKH